MVAVFNEFIITEDYEWALDAIIEALRISRDVGSDEAVIFLRERLWEHASKNG